MQYTIQINQLSFVKLGEALGIDFTVKHAVVFDFIRNFANSRRIKKRIFQDDPESLYYKIDYQHILDQNPLLKLTTTKSIQNHINDLIKADIFAKRIDNYNEVWIAFSVNYDTIIEFKDLIEDDQEEHILEPKPPKPRKNRVEKNFQGGGKKFPGGWKKISSYSNNQNTIKEHIKENEFSKSEKVVNLPAKNKSIEKQNTPPPKQNLSSLGNLSFPSKVILGIFQRLSESAQTKMYKQYGHRPDVIKAFDKYLQKNNPSLYAHLSTTNKSTTHNKTSKKVRV